MKRIPEHMKKYEWYASHLAWLKTKGVEHGDDFGDAKPMCADLRDVDLSGASLSGAYLRGANLSDANLSDADLSYANLRYTDLRCANLSDANLRCAYLSGANLSGADLSDADLRCAYLSGANLSDADLRYVDLRDANLSDADLRYVDLRDANLRYTNLSGADLRGANLSDAEIPSITNIDKAIYEAINKEGCSLNMAQWHTCETTHCRAGWAVILAGEKGLALEKEVGTNAAGALIYAKSRPDKRVPDWYASDEEVMEELELAAKATGE